MVWLEPSVSRLDGVLCRSPLPLAQSSSKQQAGSFQGIQTASEKIQVKGKLSGRTWQSSPVKGRADELGLERSVLKRSPELWEAGMACSAGSRGRTGVFLSFFLLRGNTRFFVPTFAVVVLGLRGCSDFSLVAVSRDDSKLQCRDFSLWWPLLLGSIGSRARGSSSCGARA